MADGAAPLARNSGSAPQSNFEQAGGRRDGRSLSGGELANCVSMFAGRSNGPPTRFIETDLNGISQGCDYIVGFDRLAEPTGVEIGRPASEQNLDLW